jgi:hypothetical protein
VLPLGFRFDIDAVDGRGVAHRTDCNFLAQPLPDDAVSVCTAGVIRAERCRRERPSCRPPFETLLSKQLEDLVGTRAG